VLRGIRKLSYQFRAGSRHLGSCTSSHGPPAALPRTWKLSRTGAATSHGRRGAGVPSGRKPERSRKPRPSTPPVVGGRVRPGVGAPWLAGQLPIWTDNAQSTIPRIAPLAGPRRAASGMHRWNTRHAEWKEATFRKRRLPGVIGKCAREGVHPRGHPSGLRRPSNQRPNAPRPFRPPRTVATVCIQVCTSLQRFRNQVF
jgi:hypothetical protein